jgi:hypothetical protein
MTQKLQKRLIESNHQNKWKWFEFKRKNLFSINTKWTCISRIKQSIKWDNYFENEKGFLILSKVGQSTLFFKNIHKTIRVPLVYYADLEAVSRKLNHKRLKARHEACACSFIGLSSFYSNFKNRTFNSSKDTTNSFVQTVKRIDKS